MTNSPAPGPGNDKRSPTMTENGLLERLAQERDLLAAAFERAGVGFCLVGPDDRIIMANDAWLISKGLTPERATGRGIFDLFPEEHDLLVAIHDRVQAGETVNLPRRAQWVEGRETWWEGTAAPLPTPGGMGAVITAREVSALVRAEMEHGRLLAESRRQQEFLERLIETAPIGIAVVRGPEARYELVNPYCQAIPGTPNVPMVGRTVAEVFPSIASNVAATVAEVYRTGKRVNVRESEVSVGPGREHTYWDIDHIPLFDSQGHVERVLIMIQEVTERVLARKRAEEAAAQAEASLAQLDAAIASIADGFIIYGPQGEILRANAIAERLLGYTPALSGATLTERMASLRVETTAGTPFPLEEMPPVRALRGETVRGVIMVLHRQDGRTIWTSVSAAPIRTPDGAIQGATLIITDITALHALQDRIAHAYAAERRARAEAEAAVRARDEFLAAAAHEFKTPVTSLRGFAQLTARRLAKEGTVDPETVRHALQTIDQQADRLARLVSQLLDVSTIQIGGLEIKREEVDLTELVRDALARSQAGTRRHPLVLQVPPSLPAFVDPPRIEQVIINLLDNAAKFSPEGSPIEVDLTTPDPDTARISVRDHGPGIPPERRERLFSRFYQAQTGRPFAGLGLGLYFSRQIIELHGGHITVEFPPEGGTRLVVTLPRGEPEAGNSSR